jgi:hypothetical protein
MIPINIVDLAEKLLDKNLRENERMNYQQRLEAIRDYCEDALRKSNNRISAVRFKEIRTKTGYSRIGRNNV